MTIRQRMILISGLWLVVGGFALSYRSFHLDQKEQMRNSERVGQELAGWVAQSIEQRLSQLEASVSYLDKSTVESLKRLGARYFAYVYKSQNEWNIKWKQLGIIKKEQILTEIKQISFDQFTDEKRAWHLGPDRQFIYIVPVALSKSYQLQEGFLVFGLKSGFFQFIQSRETPVTLLTENHQTLEGFLPPQHQRENLFVGEGMLSVPIEKNQENFVLTSYFSPLSQLWILHQRKLLLPSFFKSSSFDYFLVAAGFGFLMLLIFFNQSSGSSPIPVEAFKEAEGRIEIKDEDTENAIIDQFAVIPNSVRFAKGLPFQENSQPDSVLERKNDGIDETRDPIPSPVIQDSKRSTSDISRKDVMDIFQLKNFDFSESTQGKPSDISEKEIPSEKEVPLESSSISQTKILSEPSDSSIEKEASLAPMVETKPTQGKPSDISEKEIPLESDPPPVSEMETQRESVGSDPVRINSQVGVDRHGLFEFDNGHFKIRIRPPRKKEKNVRC